MTEKIIDITNKKFNKLLKLKKPKIAFGLKEPNTEILQSLRRAKRYAEIVLVGLPKIKNIRGFEVVIDRRPEEKIASMLANDEVEGIIRGTIDDFRTYEAYERLAGEKYTLEIGIFEDPFGRQFLLGPGSNPEGWEKEERLKIATGLANFLKSWEVKPKIAVFTGVRHETYRRRKHIRKGVIGFLNRTHEEAEWIVAQLKKRGYQAKNWAIDLNPAVEAGFNVLIPVNGMVGNQIFRAVLFCGGKVLIAPRWGLSRCYEDNSRTEKDFSFHIKWLVAWINSKKIK